MNIINYCGPANEFSLVSMRQFMFYVCALSFYTLYKHTHIFIENYSFPLNLINRKPTPHKTHKNTYNNKMEKNVDDEKEPLKHYISDEPSVDDSPKSLDAIDDEQVASPANIPDKSIAEKSPEKVKEPITDTLKKRTSTEKTTETDLPTTEKKKEDAPKKPADQKAEKTKEKRGSIVSDATKLPTEKDKKPSDAAENAKEKEDSVTTKPIDEERVKEKDSLVSAKPDQKVKDQGDSVEKSSKTTTEKTKDTQKPTETIAETDMENDRSSKKKPAEKQLGNKEPQNSKVKEQVGPTVMDGQGKDTDVEVQNYIQIFTMVQLAKLKMVAYLSFSEY